MKPTYTLMSQPKKVVIFPLVPAAYLTIDDSPSHLVAASRGRIEQIQKNVLGSVFPHIAQRTIVNSASLLPAGGDVEEVMRLKPDAIFILAGASSIDPLRAFRMPNVIRIRPGGNQRDDREIWKLMGEVSGESTRVDTLLSRYAEKRRETLAAISHKDRPTRVAVLDYFNDLAILGSKSSWLNDKLEAVGVQNVGPEMGRPFSTDSEDLIRLNPDVLLLISSSYQYNTPDNVYSNPRFQTLRAVRDRRIYKVPMYSFADEFAEEPLLLDWLEEVFYQDEAAPRLRSQYVRSRQFLALRPRQPRHGELCGSDVRESRYFRPVLGIWCSAYSHEGSLDAEVLITLDPDMVFLYGVNNPSPSAWYAEPAFRSLRVVRNRRVYAEPIGGSRLSGLVELPLKLRWMAELLYPSGMPRLREDFRKTYCDVYGFRLDDSALDKALRVTENSVSAGYERFSKLGQADISCPRTEQR
jgi:iron complex transport system substrate-binding protein